MLFSDNMHHCSGVDWIIKVNAASGLLITIINKVYITFRLTSEVAGIQNHESATGYRLNTFFPKSKPHVIELVSMCVSTLSLSVFHNELISLQPPSRILLPCSHSIALNHLLRSIKRCGYPGRRESCLSFHSCCFLPLSVFFVSRHFDLLTPSLPFSLTPCPFSSIILFSASSTSTLFLSPKKSQL